LKCGSLSGIFMAFPQGSEMKNVKSE